MDDGDDDEHKADDDMAETEGAASTAADTTARMPVVLPPRKGLNIQFDSAHDDGDDEQRSLRSARLPGAKGGVSSKVVPMDNHSENLSVQSKGSVAMFHKLVESGKYVEEHSLVLLRRILIVVSLVVLAMSLAAMQLSKAVVRNGMQNVVLTSLEGERQTYVQVSRCVTIRVPYDPVIGHHRVIEVVMTRSCCGYQLERLPVH